MYSLPTTFINKFSTENLTPGSLSVSQKITKILLNHFIWRLLIRGSTLCIFSSIKNFGSVELNLDQILSPGNLLTRKSRLGLKFQQKKGLPFGKSLKSK